MKKILEDAYLKLFVTIFISGAAIIAFYFCFKNMWLIKREINDIIYILMPFIYGLIIAYLLCPVYNVTTRHFYHRFKLKLPKKSAFILAKVLGTIIAILFLTVIVVSAALLLVPQIVNSLVALVDIMPKKANEFSVWLYTVSDGTKYQRLMEMMSKSVDNASATLVELLKKHVMPNVGSYLEMVSQGVIFTLRTFMHIFVGVIVSVYVLNSKERFKAEGRKVIRAIFSESKAEEVFWFFRFANKTFGGFINGKIIDSIIIGIICFILMTIFHLPYAVLCSTIIGVTNVIPFFGPFIGAIPSAIIICVVDPIQAGEFLILIFFLQQFDGNILGPKILGDSTGLTSFWVMFAIILFGGLFGALGMILGVPVFAIIYFYIKKMIESNLKKKGLEPSTEEYMEFNKYEIDKEDLL